jgi:hypothetical protein
MLRRADETVQSLPGNPGLTPSATASAFCKWPRMPLPASLDDIAKQTGVGPGTLYRHIRGLHRNEEDYRPGAQRAGRKSLEGDRTLLRPDSGGDSCAGETRYQEWRGQKGPGPNRLASGSGRRLLHGDQPGLAAKRQETGGHAHLRFAAGEIDKQPLVSVFARSLPTPNSARTSSPLRVALSFRCALKSSAGTSYCSAAGRDNWADWDRHSSSVRRDRHISLRRRTEGSA